MREVPSKPKLNVQLNLLDKVISLYDPVKAVYRMRARAQLGMMATISGGNSYKGASKSRRGLAGWVTNLIGGSADTDTLPDLPTLRERSRDLARNAPIATGAISGTTLKVVGTGLRVASKINHAYLGLTEDQAREWQKAAEFEFNTWAKSTECDATRYQNFAGLQALVFQSTLESGDCFPLLARPIKKPGDRLPYRTKLQIIEADRVCNPQRRQDGDMGNGNTIAAGIELDADGMPVRYHIMRSHPGNKLINLKASEWDSVPAFGEKTGRRNVLHLMKRLRPGQTRGVPFLAPVIEVLKQLDRYTEAEIMAAVVSGMFAVFIKHTGEGPSPLDSATTGDRPGTTGDAVTSSWDGSLSSGLVADLQPGEEITTASSSRPNVAFNDFVLAILRQVGMALDIPFEVLVKHFQSSYSASRAALLEAWNFYYERREWLATYFCQPVYEAVIEEAVVLGRLSAPGFLADPFVRAAYLRTVWAGDGPGSIDPAREAAAAEKRMALHITTLEDEVMSYDGTDYEDKLRQAGREKEMRQQYGLATPTIAGAALAPEEPARAQDDTTDLANTIDQDKQDLDDEQ